jgi:glutathione S-transferase
MTRPVVHHIPVCPFSQRLEILLALKGCRAEVDFQVVDITQPRPEALLRKTGGPTPLPVLETADGRILRESLVLLRYLDEVMPGPAVAAPDPYRRAVEGMLTRLEGEFVHQGYAWVMNQDPARRDGFASGMLQQYRRLDAFLRQHAPSEPFLFDAFGWAETVFTPIFVRFHFLAYYEDFQLPDTDEFARVRRWVEACLAHPAAQQVSAEEVVKLYHDYAKGAGNGALLPGRRRSSFVFAPHWRERPWPPRDKYRHAASDEELGL